MMVMADSMINYQDEKVRIRNAYLMIPMLLEILDRPHSFNYPLDSVRAISKVYAPDSSFRVFTWQLQMGSSRFRHMGAIQMNRDTLKLYPLFDASDFIQNPEDTITNRRKWYGCMYYNATMKVSELDSTKFYYFFGYDPSDMFSTKKLIEVIHFDDDEPVFGAKKFHYDSEDTTYTLSRFLLEYKKDGNASLNFHPEFDKIIFDHLTPLNPGSQAAVNFVPDGTYEGFEYDGDKWVHVEKVFHQAINQRDNPPVPKPLDFEDEREQRKRHRQDQER